MSDWRWRPMLMADTIKVCAIGDEVHADYPESDEVFLERWHLWPRGCHVLEFSAGIMGYCVSHPWLRRQPPHLNLPLGSLPTPPETYYVHDVALLPPARGLGAGVALMAKLEIHARALGLREMALIAVYDAPRYWARHGFTPVLDDAALAAKTASYGTGTTYMERRLEPLLA
ncbi:Acetyltransferase (GNAT) family protein [Arboricoccus pini]|uniref:Acetyltransferase (GNAT) family protein n=1 Tax=Arboricoccus pini TaxID=1963835 RepID=A0A212QRU7_9PROT|nr:GNAT family N-acetyltransferase [Arboricoccus pini]SNB62263.1 Acetyltransferase (GNAT) family protein [Arboricoccus pini]